MGTRRFGRTAAPVAAAAAIALMVSSCSGGSSSTDTATDTATDTTSAAAGGDLVIGVTSDPDTLLPWTATQFQAVNVLQTMYGTLTEFDEDLNVVPGLAESWDVSDDGLTVTFHLREGVTFADGAEFDSADVVYSLEAIKDEATAAVSAATLSAVESVEATDASTVVLTMASPDAALFANLAVVNMAMLNSDDSLTDLESAPNGTGAFAFSERTPSESLTVVRNDNYWGDPAPLDSVEFRVIPDETSIVSALQSGNVQLAVFDDPLVAQTAESDTITITDTPQLSYHVLQLNAAVAPFDDLNVRLALQCAIDRQEVLDTAAQGEGEITGPITSPAYKSDPNDRVCPTKDLDKAKEYLEAAGYGEGELAFDLMVSQGEYSTSVAEAQNVQSQLAEAGITVNLDVLESGTYVDRWVAADFGAAIALNGGRPDPDGMYSRYFTSTGNLNKVAGYSSPELDELFAEGKATSDVETRKEIYTKVSEELEDNAAWIWLFTSYSYTATAEGVTGFVPMANGSMQYLRTTALG